MSAVTKPSVSQFQAGQRQPPLAVWERAKDKFEIAEFFRRLKTKTSRANFVRFIDKISTLFVNKKKLTRFDYAKVEA